jgi:hypothetical protein
MSDLQDLIHTLTVKAYESGVRHEQERIISILETNQCKDEDHPGECSIFIQDVDGYIALIKGENNG